MTHDRLSDKIMRRAAALATAAGAASEVPVAAIITDPDGQIIAEAVNAIQETDKPRPMLKCWPCNWRWQKQARLVCQIMIFGSPGAMCHVCRCDQPCALAPPLFRAYDPKGGAVNMALPVQPETIHHQPEIFGGIHERACAELLRNFFRKTDSPV